MTRALLLLAAISGAAAAARTPIGVYQGWGAFRDTAPVRCYAIARAVAAGGRSGAFAGVATWPDRHLRGSLHVRLSRAHDRAAPVTLSIGERRFALVARDADGASDAWAADAASDHAIVAAMRSGRSMSVEAVGAGGTPFADVYALAGAATAIDAAALACAGR